MLGQIDCVTRYLQKKNLSLSSCCLALDTFTKAVETTKDYTSSSLYMCKLGFYYISLQNTQLCPNRYFETGVVKIQRRQEAQLNLKVFSIHPSASKSKYNRCCVSSFGASSRFILTRIDGDPDGEI